MGKSEAQSVFVCVSTKREKKNLLKGELVLYNLSSSFTPDTLSLCPSHAQYLKNSNFTVLSKTRILPQSNKNSQSELVQC